MIKNIYFEWIPIATCFKIQERALRFVFKDFDSTYENLLLLAKMPSIKCMIDRKIATEVFKAVNKMGPEYISDLFKLKVNTAHLRGRNKLEIPSVNTTKYGLHSIAYYGAKLWNALPEHFRLCDSLSEFKRLICNWNGFSCKCNLCK